jgi:predicted DNA-binding transcriptional regulator AlpA
MPIIISLDHVNSNAVHVLIAIYHRRNINVRSDMPCFIVSNVTEYVVIRLTSVRRPPMLSHVEALCPTPARTTAGFLLSAVRESRRPPSQDNHMLLTTRAVAQHFGRTPETIRRWVRNGEFPAPVILPGGRAAWPHTVLTDAGTNRGGTTADTVPLDRLIP